VTIAASSPQPPPPREFEEALDAYVRFAAHQLGEGVRIVTGWAEALEEEYGRDLTGAGRHALDAIVSGGRRLQQFVDDLLQLAALAHDDADETRREVVLDDVLAAAVTELVDEWHTAGARLRGMVKPHVVIGNRRSLELLFQQLLRGALAARSGALVVTVASVEEGPWVRVDVQDNGLAVSAEEARDAFLPLAPPRGRGPLLGAGVGPLICRRVVERHGGRIWAEPGESAGMVIHFTLPRA
jgi:signal transduction histidine kinase